MKLSPEQVQLYTPLPSTYSAVMYHSGLDPFTRKPIFVEREAGKRERQKRIVTEKRKKSR